MDLSEKLFTYLKSKIKGFEKTTKKGAFLFTCPNIDNHKFKAKSPTATIITGSDKISCLQCSWKGTFYDVIRLLEPDKKDYSDAQITEYLINTMHVDMYSELEQYKIYKWALVPIAKNGKSPIEKDWTNITHYEKVDWIKWLNNSLNIGVRTGEASGITVIDVDNKNNLTEEGKQIKLDLVALLNDINTLEQNTPHGGKHYVFQYDKDIPQTVDIAGLKIDVRNDGGQILVQPSKIDNLSYAWLNPGFDIKKIPENVKAKLLELMKVEVGRKDKMSQEMTNNSDNPIELVNNNLEGRCNDTFVQFGGALIKMCLPIDKIKIILHYLNRNWLRNSMPTDAVDAMIGSLEGYKGTEEQTQEQAIYEACQVIQTDISAKDIIDHVFPGDNKKRAIVDKYLAKFHKEGKLSRRGRGKYDCKTKVEWTDEIIDKNKEINFKMPYFNEIAYFNSGDILLLGAPTGGGKTHIAMNIIKQLKEQGIKPYYISLESGSRHIKIAEKLNLTQKDYYISKDPIDNPLQIEIEPDSVTIIDWIYTGDDFAATQSVYKHLNDEMARKGGILIVFTQLKENYEYFAVNLIKTFPSFSARFIYDDTENRIFSHWQVDKIRESIGNYFTATIPCEFNFETKILTKKDLI
jgi:tRNA A37 threonylcarbamoyladenosine biosynthesis protein TsaE